jgi:hypothetical protein
MAMDANVFYPRLIGLAAQPPKERHRLLTALHGAVLAEYLPAIEATPQAAMHISSDGRAFGQVVGHIAEWERFGLIALGEILARVQWPRIMSLSGYVEPSGEVRNFTSVDEFNAYQANKHATWPWERIQRLALATATTLHTLCTTPGLLAPAHLEETRVYRWSLPEDQVLELPVGWYLWMVSLAHAAVEHADDLAAVRQLSSTSRKE